MTNTYRKLGEGIVQVRLSKGFDQTPEHGLHLYERRHKNKLTSRDAFNFKKGWRRGRLIYWLKRVYSISRRMNATAINGLVTILESYSTEVVTRETVGMTGIDAKIADYTQRAETFDGLHEMNNLLLARLNYHVYHEPWRKVYQWVLYRGDKVLADFDRPATLNQVAPLFYDDTKQALALGEGNEQFRLRYKDGQWGVKAGARDENHKLVEVVHAKVEVAILIAMLLRTE